MKISVGAILDLYWPRDDYSCYSANALGILLKDDDESAKIHFNVVVEWAIWVWNRAKMP